MQKLNQIYLILGQKQIYKIQHKLKNAAGVDTSKCVKDIDLASLKSETDKLDIHKLGTTPVDLSKLSNVVKTEVIKKTVYGKLLKKVNAIQTNNASNLVKKTDYDTKSW